jgi:ribosomal protein S18 acetylase RimI-like enzyme
MILRFNQLDDIQLKALDALSERCKLSDGNLVARYRHLLATPRPLPCNALYYHNEQLIGFLRTFFFQSDECEIALMVDPKYRHQGIASSMLNEVMPMIEAEEIKRLVFSSPHELNNDWFKTLALHYQYTEYQMVYRSNRPIKLTGPSGSKIRRATVDDTPVLCSLDKVCFPKENAMSVFRFEELLHDPHYDLFVILNQNTVLGKAHLSYEEMCTRLTDIAVIPQAQGHGFGSALIAHCIHHVAASNKPQLVLDVETHNKNALNLYKKLNFSITNACDFWEKSIE